MARRITLKHPRIIELAGCNDLTLIFDAALVRPRAERNDIVKVHVQFGRATLGCLLKQIRAMHERDLERLSAERARLDREANALVRDGK